MPLYVEKIFIISLIVFSLMIGAKLKISKIYKVILHPIMIYAKLVLILLVVLKN